MVTPVSTIPKNERELICDALQKDFGKPKTEVLMGEVGCVIKRSVKSAEQLPQWAETEYPNVADNRTRVRMYKAPRGTALIISPWNCPMILSFQPLIGAIAAGCTAILKPSELVPTFSQLWEEIVPKYLDPNTYRVVNGAVPETSKLLELQWAHIFYTGNGRVARIIASAAAKHLMPLMLELGGKSPVIIDSAYDIDLAAKRIPDVASCNICVAPDYVLIQQDKQDELVKAFRKHYNAFFPKGALDSPLFGRIVSDQHHKCLTSLLSRTKGEVVLQGHADTARRDLSPALSRMLRTATLC
ncbi:Aldehyde/histidinol dehydrogenase [Suillus americanus]|nr:Aldehyde/histidinol dehydrogenase [Suillus americanus]